MNEQQQIDCFGCLIEDIATDGFIMPIREGDKFEYLMRAMQILSDAQELMHRSNTKEANQCINKAKYLVNQIMQQVR